MRVLGTRPALARQRVSGAMKTRLARCKPPMLSGSRSRNGSVMSNSGRRVRLQVHTVCGKAAAKVTGRTHQLTDGGPSVTLDLSNGAAGTPFGEALGAARLLPVPPSQTIAPPANSRLAAGQETTQDRLCLQSQWLPSMRKEISPSALKTPPSPGHTWGRNFQAIAYPVTPAR